jgi:hypothetical protein
MPLAAATAADDDGAGTDDHDFFDVAAFWHLCFLSSWEERWIRYCFFTAGVYEE